MEELQENQNHRNGMKPQPIHPRQQYATRKLILDLIVVAIGFAIVCALTSCTLTVSPDGSRTYGIDGAQVVKGIIVIATESK